MSDSSSQQHVLFAQGLYRVQRFWGSLNNGLQFSVLSSVAVGSDGAVYCAQRNGAPVLVFEPDGELRATWPRTVATDPHGINIIRGTPDTVLLVDRDAHQVLHCTVSGEIIARLGERDRPRFQAPFNHPTSAFAAPDGDVYVADGYGNSVVHRFNANGEHICTWGSVGSGDGEFSTPHSIWVDRQNRVLVVDRENCRVQVFDRNGQYAESWFGFYKPMDITEDDSGYLYVSDQIPRVSQLSPAGTLVGRARPVWNVPHGMAHSPDGRLFFVEMNPNSLVCLSLVE